MKDVIVDLFGSYEPILFDGASDGIASLDWEWISGVLLFSISLYCVFRIVGAIFGRR